jgi:hypothetical protein
VSLILSLRGGSFSVEIKEQLLTSESANLSLLKSAMSEPPAQVIREQPVNPIMFAVVDRHLRAADQRAPSIASCTLRKRGYVFTPIAPSTNPLHAAVREALTGGGEGGPLSARSSNKARSRPSSARRSDTKRSSINNVNNGSVTARAPSRTSTTLVRADHDEKEEEKLSSSPRNDEHPNPTNLASGYAQRRYRDVHAPKKSTEFDNNFKQLLQQRKREAESQQRLAGLDIDSEHYRILHRDELHLSNQHDIVIHASAKDMLMERDRSRSPRRPLRQPINTIHNINNNSNSNTNSSNTNNGSSETARQASPTRDTNNNNNNTASMGRNESRNDDDDHDYAMGQWRQVIRPNVLATSAQALANILSSAGITSTSGGRTSSSIRDTSPPAPSPPLATAGSIATAATGGSTSRSSSAISSSRAVDPLNSSIMSYLINNRHVSPSPSLPSSSPLPPSLHLGLPVHGPAGSTDVSPGGPFPELQSHHIPPLPSGSNDGASATGTWHIDASNNTTGISSSMGGSEAHGGPSPLYVYLAERRRHRAASTNGTRRSASHMGIVGGVAPLSTTTPTTSNGSPDGMSTSRRLRTSATPLSAPTSPQQTGHHRRLIATTNGAPLPPMEQHHQQPSTITGNSGVTVRSASVHSNGVSVSTSSMDTSSLLRSAPSRGRRLTRPHRPPSAVSVASIALSNNHLPHNNNNGSQSVPVSPYGMIAPTQPRARLGFIAGRPIATARPPSASSHRQHHHRVPPPQSNNDIPSPVVSSISFSLQAASMNTSISTSSPSPASSSSSSGGGVAAMSSNNPNSTSTARSTMQSSSTAPAYADSVVLRDYHTYVRTGTVTSSSSITNMSGNNSNGNGSIRPSLSPSPPLSSSVLLASSSGAGYGSDSSITQLLQHDNDQQWSHARQSAAIAARLRTQSEQLDRNFLKKLLR